MQKYAIGQPCAGECAKTIDGISYTCPKCGGVHYCYTCAYCARLKCPKCGTLTNIKRQVRTLLNIKLDSGIINEPYLQSFSAMMTLQKHSTITCTPAPSRRRH